MSTLAEIEAAAVTLTPEEMQQLETFLREARERAEEERLMELAHANGFHPFPRSPGDKVVTDEIVRRIREEEGI